MTYPNQYYQPNYYMPQYQNLQAQQRQEQLNQVFNNTYNYNFVREKSEAENWPVAPGSHLVFEDQNGLYFYTKSLGFNPNERPIFTVYKREDFVEKEQPKELPKEDPNKEEIAKIQNEVSELKEMFKQFTTNKNQYHGKGGGK